MSLYTITLLIAFYLGPNLSQDESAPVQHHEDMDWKGWSGKLECPAQSPDLNPI